MRLCSIEGCASKHLARGLCRNHYGQLTRRRESPVVPLAENIKHCSECGGEMCDDFWRPIYIVGCGTCTQRRVKREARKSRKDQAVA